MKIKNLLYWATALCFTVLFYQQNIGLNYFLFAIILVANCIFLNKTILQSTLWRIVASALLFSSSLTIYYGNALTVTMSIISFLILLIVKNKRSNSIMTSLIGGIILEIATFAFILLGLQYRSKLNLIESKYKRIKNNKWIPVIAIVVVSSIFISLYCSINPVFSNFTSELLTQVSWDWVFFTIFGALILYTFFFPPRIIRPILKLEERIKQNIHIESIHNSNSIGGVNIDFKSEKLTATVMFAILNVLLFSLISTDINYLFIETTLPYSLTLSEYVHNGVGAVIVSIIFAILLILFYFRGNMNFDNSSKVVKVLTYIWIVLNVFLVFLTMYKNQLYIDSFAMTYKRIGVIFYLFFAFTGLVLTAYKLFAFKSAWFLVKSNSLFIYIILTLSCLLNWNMIVTEYNIKRSKTPDFEYLSDLGYENYPTLWSIGGFNCTNSVTIDLNLTSVKQTYHLPEKIADFLKEYEEVGVQSYCYEKKRTYDFFQDLAKEDKLPISNRSNTIVK